VTAGVVAARWAVSALPSAAAMPAETWSRLARRGFHLHQWFRAAEDSGWRPRHVVATHGAEPRAVLPVYLTGAETPHDLHERWLGPLRWLDRIGLGLRPVLSVQSPFSLTSDALGDLGSLPRHALERLFEVLEETARAERAKAVVWPFVDPSDEAVIALARERGYLVVPAGSTARLRIWWDAFDEYVASRSKSVRRTIRADLASLDAGGLETVTSTEFAAQAERMDALYRAAYRRRNAAR
jgi:predicted N-acyltransferase